MIGRERRERVHRDFSPRSEGRAEGRNNLAPPSRHLWIGNLSHNINENTLSEQCLRFGELDSLAFLPGRSYAFVNFRKEEDAIIAMRALQGFNLAGLPLKIEFAKAERSMPSTHEQKSMPSSHEQWRDERRSVQHGSPFQRDPRANLTSPEKLYTEKSRMGDKNAEPSEVLWIGFPSFLNVDEMLLRESFSPFGEIEKITAFPGRSYAFVKFRSIAAACRAKAALQGKLLDNPRVSICFAKSEMNLQEQGRNSMNPPFSPHFKPNGHPGRPIEFREDRFGEPYRGSPRFTSDLESRDSSVIGFSRKAPAWTGATDNFEPLGLQGPRPHLGFSEDVYERQNSPVRGRCPQHYDYSPSKPLRKNPFLEDLPGMRDSFAFHEAKKLKTGPFPPDKELPEYPFSDASQDKHHTGLPTTFPNLPEHGNFDKSFGSGSFSYNNKIADRPMNLAPHPIDERSKNWNPPHERFETGSGSLPMDPVKLKVPTPESHQSPLKEEWKWEGTIAKGGTPVCRARCFPVGKPLDITLPGFLNCTARTSLDMLAKHFYQAASAWVVFFVPESDADMALYNEFMHYLGEKQRAAVAKLGEKTTLFLVPPSNFSEKVLKVPGKLSISGVILRFQDVNSDFGSSLNQQPLDTMDSKLPSHHEDRRLWGPNQSHANLPPQPFPSSNSFTNPRKQEVEDVQFSGNMPAASISGSTHLTGRAPEAFNEPQQLPHQHTPNWSHHASGNLHPTQERPNTKPGVVQETSSTHFTPTTSHQETKPVPIAAALQPDQLAQLASLLVQRQQPESAPAVAQTQVSRDEGNPHTRLQATLQLAATLLQQIQQQAKGTDQR